MDLRPQCLSADINFDKAILIELPAGAEALIIYSFVPTVRQNLLALSRIDASTRPETYLLAQWRDTTQDYRLKNGSVDKQFWYLSGWEVYGITGGGPTLDCPGYQDGVRMKPSVHIAADLLSETPYYDGAGIRPGEPLASVQIIL